MNFLRTRFLLAVVALTIVFLNSTLDVQGAVFDISYHNIEDDVIGTIVGTGSLSFDGQATFGEFPLDTLSNLQFSAVVDGTEFNTADISTDLTMSNLLVFVESGQTLATFTGSGGIAGGGSFDLEAPGGEILTHEPGPAGSPCCGGTDVARLYGAQTGSSSFVLGFFQMVLVPEPSAATLALAVLVCWTMNSRSFGVTARAVAG